MTDDTTEHEDQPPATLREYAMHVWQVLCRIIGPPAELRERGKVGPGVHRVARDWLRCLELLVRRIIMMTGLKLDLAPADYAPPTPGKPRLHTSRAQRNPRFIIRRNREARARTWRQRKAKFEGPFPAQPIANRLEAIHHALANIDAYARRYAISVSRQAAADPTEADMLIGVHPWSMPLFRQTSGEDAIHDAMIASGPLASQVLDTWLKRWVEPG